MALNYYTKISLNENEITDASVERVTADPSGFIGQIIFNTTQSKYKFFDGTSWLEYSSVGDLLAETNARIAADQILQGNIDAEAFARQTADDLLQLDIDAEETARIAADQALQVNIDAKQDELVSGTNIKTINGTSVLGTGDIVVGGVSDNIGTSDLTITDNERVLTLSGTAEANKFKLGKLIIDGEGSVYNDNVLEQTSFGYKSGISNSGASQSAFGSYAGQSNTGGSQTSVGYLSGLANSANNQSAFGSNAGYFNSGENQCAFGGNSGISNSGANQSAFGYEAGRQNSGDNNSNFGFRAGRYLSDGINFNTSSSDSVFLGSSTKALGASQTNQIVIGHDTTGSGSNSVTLGNTNIVLTVLRGVVNMAGVPTSSAGLNTGDVWSDNGTLKIV